MEFRIWVEVRLAGRVLDRRLVAQVEREVTRIGPEEIGLTLEEGKTVLSQVQAGVIHRQVEALQAAHRNCLQCGRKQRIKDRRRRCLRTIFGVVRVSCCRYLRCRCQGGKSVTVWPLNGRQALSTTPELQYLYADWGSKVPYRRAATVLQELLPGRVSHATLRRSAEKLVHASNRESSSRASKTGQSQGENRFLRRRVSALPLTEPMFERMERCGCVNIRLWQAVWSARASWATISPGYPNIVCALRRIS